MHSAAVATFNREQSLRCKSDALSVVVVERAVRTAQQRDIQRGMARAFLTEPPNCLPRCLPQRVFCAGTIAEVLAAQAQLQKVSDLPPKATLAGVIRMSALCQKRALAIYRYRSVTIKSSGAFLCA
jgi:hypothetical protein